MLSLNHKFVTNFLSGQVWIETILIYVVHRLNAYFFKDNTIRKTKSTEDDKVDIINFLNDKNL